MFLASFRDHLEINIFSNRQKNVDKQTVRQKPVFYDLYCLLFITYAKNHCSYKKVTHKFRMQIKTVFYRVRSLHNKAAVK